MTEYTVTFNKRFDRDSREGIRITITVNETDETHAVVKAMNILAKYTTGDWTFIQVKRERYL